MDGQCVTGHERGGSEDRVDVLYVDAADDASAVRSRLVDHGPFAVEHVPDADAAQKRLSAAPADCLVSEYDLPDENGVSLLRTVRDEWPALPFVLLTDASGDGVARRAIEADVSGYVERTPIDEQVPALAETITTALQRHNDRLSILGRMTDAFFALDDSWEFTYLNERGREIICEAAGVERSAAALVGTNLWDQLPEAVDTTFYDRYHEAMANQESVTFEAQYDPLDTWFEVRAYPAAGGLSVYFRDISDRKERMQELRERERVLEEMYRIVSAKDLTFNEQVSRLLSIGREVLGTDAGVVSRREGEEYVFEAIQDPTAEIEPGDRVPLEQTNCERAIVTEETLVLEDIARAAPDHPECVPVAESGVACYLGTPVIVDGDVYGTFCFYDREPRTEPFSDWEISLVELLGNWISYERERRHHRSEIARERNRMAEFASVVSHDLRNPLGVALGRLDAARETHAPEHFDAIERSLERMDALIDDVLTLAREGEAVTDPESVALAGIVDDAWAVLDAADATVHNDVTERYIADPGRLQRLIENLLRNAIEHVGTDVTITVGDLDAGRGFYVADDGPGIAPEQREQVFEPGFTTSEDGTGFGLKIVAEIAQAHGASVTVTESADGGARFEIRDLDHE